LISHLRSLGAVAAVVKLLSCFLVTSLPWCSKAAEVPGIQSGSHPTLLGCWWWVSAQTSSAMQLAFASKESSMRCLYQSWCPLTQLTFDAMGRVRFHVGFLVVGHSQT
jgi:hypothetical protein